MKITKRHLESLRESIVANNFKSKALEIEFFKITKPQLYCKLIYYVNLFNIESKRPRGSHKSQIKYFNKNIISFKPILTII
nr:RteC domain-containing protein [Tamlana sedimentorum]